MNINNVKVIFLDFNGTLSDSVFWGHLQNTDKHKFFEEVRTSLFDTFSEEIKPWMRGELKSEEILGKVAKDTGYDFEEVYNEFKIGCEMMELADEQIRTVVKNLQEKGVLCVISTDNMDSFTRWTAPSLRLADTFDEILNSADIHSLKRDKNDKGHSALLAGFLELNNISPKESIMIDDGVDKENVMSNMGVEYIQIGNSLEVRNILLSLL